ncbi:unnamed protein product [Onchocerca flexuosa]|uniref:USP domain-containing protein n=1 Tax=Onchocerca flexuosa TaxID=387005 RepID=A0A183I7F2_9BILA|nr:unnamed protein product [Onchocerca flexuosa]
MVLDWGQEVLIFVGNLRECSYSREVVKSYVRAVFVGRVHQSNCHLYSELNCLYTTSPTNTYYVIDPSIIHDSIIHITL